MFIVRIEHPVPDYDAWKQAFDSDPGAVRSPVAAMQRERSRVDRGDPIEEER